MIYQQIVSLTFTLSADELFKRNVVCQIKVWKIKKSYLLFFCKLEISNSFLNNKPITKLLQYFKQGSRHIYEKQRRNINQKFGIGQATD